jgi:hypothetical protein
VDHVPIGGSDRRTLTCRWCILPAVLITTGVTGSFTGPVSTTWGRRACSGDAGTVCVPW